MRRNALRIGVFAVLVALVCVTAAAAPLEAPGSVKSVVVYRGNALVSRAIPVKVGAGASELLVGDLPEYIVGESLFATAGPGIEVRAVRFRTRAVAEEPREELRKILADMERVRRDMELNKALQEASARAADYLAKLGNFVAATAQTEITKGVLNADTLKQVSLFVLEQQRLQASGAVELRTAAQDLAKQLDVLERKRVELDRGSSRTVREAVLFLWAEGAVTGEVTLSYLVRNAGWEPSYTVRALDASDTVKVEYSAAIYQMSGEDWKDVEVTLSTASPALMADGPELAPFWVSLSSEPVAGFARLDLAQERYAQLQSEQAGKAMAQRAAASQSDRKSVEWDMNVTGGAIQLFETNAPMAAGARIEPARPAEGMSVTYKLPGRAAIESRSDRQLVRIADLECKADFYYVATPLLTSFVYRRADVENESTVAMLEGPAAVYRNGGFVGKSDVPMVAQGQKFSIGFGLEAQLRTSREMVDRTEEQMGANRVVDFKYRLGLENSMDKPVTVRVYDRLPYPTEKADIRITQGEMTDELSDDPLYLEAERPKGILRWDIEVPARASGVDVKKVEYSYKMEFDRRLNVATPLAEGARAGEDINRLRGEFQALNEDRRRAR